MSRKLFCEISPFTYKISMYKEIFKRHLKNLLSFEKYAKEKSGVRLENLVYTHNSLIRRRLGDVDMELQENKSVNLSLAAPKVSGIIIKPGETFSFWKLVGSCSKAKGYREGMTIAAGKPSKGTGGGMCQFTNLIHWMILHSPLDICEHHHHDGMDLFPDFGRQIPFGCGTSIMYNYLDYRFQNNTDITFQLVAYTNGTHLCGELRADKPLDYKYHVIEKDACFALVGDTYYRRNKIFVNKVDKRTGNQVECRLVKENNAKVMYDEKYINSGIV